MQKSKMKTMIDILEIEKPNQNTNRAKFINDKSPKDYLNKISFSPINQNDNFSPILNSELSPIRNITDLEKKPHSFKRNEKCFFKKLNNMTVSTCYKSHKYNTPSESGKIKLISQTFHEKHLYQSPDTEPNANKKLELFSFYNSKEYGCQHIFMPKSIKSSRMRPKISVFEKYYLSTKTDSDKKRDNQTKSKIILDFEGKQFEKKQEKKEMQDKLNMDDLNDIILQNKIRHFMKNNYDQLNLFGDNQLEYQNFFAKSENKINFKFDINLAPTIQNKLEILKSIKTSNPEFETGYEIFHTEKIKLKDSKYLCGVPRKIGEELSQIRVNFQIDKDRWESLKKKYGLTDDNPDLNTKKYIDFLQEINQDPNKRKNDPDYFDYFSTKYVKYKDVNFADKRAKEIVMKRKALLNTHGLFKKMIIDNVQNLNKKFLQIREELKISEQLNNITRLSKLAN
jgi:hypothetical protein